MILNTTVCMICKILFDTKNELGIKYIMGNIKYTMEISN